MECLLLYSFLQIDFDAHLRLNLSPLQIPTAVKPFATPSPSPAPRQTLPFPALPQLWEALPYPAKGHGKVRATFIDLQR
jgi:hypothetical protein